MQVDEKVKQLIDKVKTGKFNKYAEKLESILTICLIHYNLKELNNNELFR